MKLPFVLIPLTLIVVGCVSHPTTSDIRQLQVSLDNESPSYRQFFDRIEIIPLEDSDSALLASIDKIECINDTLIAYDNRRNRIKVFNSDGKYLNNIGQIGQGPEDYTLVYDLSYNPREHELSLLSPFGEYLNYTLDDRFISRVRLPEKPNYLSFTWIDDINFATWSNMLSEDPALQVIDSSTGKIQYEGWYEDRDTDWAQQHPFYVYDGSLFFAEPIGRGVYELRNDSLIKAYEWDFGKDNIDIEKYKQEVISSVYPEKSNKLVNDLKSGHLAYIVNENWQNKGYYLAKILSFSDNIVVNRILVYDKIRDTGSCISKFEEDVSINPVYVCNDFLLSPIPEEEIEIYNSILNLQISDKEDQNVILAKFYFKK